MPKETSGLTLRFLNYLLLGLAIVLSSLLGVKTVFPGVFVFSKQKQLAEQVAAPSTKFPGAARAMDEDSNLSYWRFAHTPHFDPISGKDFWLSFKVRFDGFPQVGKSAKLFTKYSRDKAPYVGWAFGFRQYDTSIKTQ